jgi:DNA repair protein RadC
MASRSSPSRQKTGTSRPISEAQEISDGEELFASPEIAVHPNAGHRERLRARFLKSGAGPLPDYELLELTLFAAIPRRDTKPLAKRLLARFGNYAEVIAASHQRLMEVEGVGEAVVNQLKIVEAAAARLSQAQVIGKPALSSWSALIDYCMATMARAPAEEFRVL